MPAAKPAPVVSATPVAQAIRKAPPSERIVVTATGVSSQSGLAAGARAANVEEGDDNDAGSLLGSASEQFRIVGSPLQAEEAERYERVLSSITTKIDVDDALARGAALTQDDVTALVRSVIASARA